ncbi:MAG: hypothetical protein R3C03_16270 [Pirellulaceae bacterium]
MTSLASFFQTRNVKAIFPSKIVSDQYRNTLIVSDGVASFGLRVENGDGSISLIQPDATRIRLDLNEIVETKTLETSPMPEGRRCGQRAADLRFSFLYPLETLRINATKLEQLPLNKPI